MLTTGALSCSAIRALEHRAAGELGLSLLVLMENAGRASAELLIRLGIPGPIVLCAGKGNNGGDAFVLARYLSFHHVSQSIWLVGHPSQLAPEAAVNYRLLLQAGVSVHVCAEETLPIAKLEAEFARSAWLIDGLFGTGLKGEVRAPFRALIDCMNRTRAQRFALDIPSGLDGDTGTPLGLALRADHTATFLAYKQGFLKPEAKEWIGQVHCLPLGLPWPWVAT